MAKCRICGKSGLFVKVNEDGVCQDCEALVARQKVRKELEAQIANKEQIVQKIKLDARREADEILARLNDQIEHKEQIIRQIKDDATREAEAMLSEKSKALKKADDDLAEKTARISALDSKIENSAKTYETQAKKVSKLRDVYKAMESSIRHYREAATDDPTVVLVDRINTDLEDSLSTTVQTPLQCLNYKDLRKKFKEIEKEVDKLASEYKLRYTTKSIAAMYQLMVIALRAELQNILSSLNFGKLEKATDQVKAMCAKYMAIASSGNQLISKTLARFIGQIEALFIEEVKIEYEVYIQKEQIKEEQRALREQLRQEATERKLLEQQQKQIAKEEEKYRNEIETLKQSLLSASVERESALTIRIAELEKQLASVNEKKEEITKLQNGKAGYVYVISNLGSFGDNVFKIGMTRRLEPQERINELGDASVPFPFDVHSFIFSDNAPELETNIHRVLNEKRVNKVNLRKEFFRVSLDDLEKIVHDLQPAAEFNRTMLAAQYNQTLSIERGEAVAFDDNAIDASLANSFDDDEDEEKEENIA